MFRGATKVTLDDKGRVVIPTRYRPFIAERCAGRITLSADLDECLLIYPRPDWEVVEQKLMALPSLNVRARRMQRIMIGYATELEMDGHGRLPVSAELREYGHITRSAMLIGQGHYLELWDEQRWIEQRQSWIEAEQSQADTSSAALDSFSL